MNRDFIVLRDIFNKSCLSKALGASVLTVAVGTNASFIYDDSTLSTENSGAKAVPDRVLSVEPNAYSSCSSIKGDGPSEESNKRVMGLRAVMEQSKTGHYLVSETEKMAGGELWVCFSKDLGGAAGIFLPDYNVIKLLDTVSIGDKVKVFFHEVRHAERSATLETFKNWKLDKDMDAYLELNGEADAEAVSSLVLWELRAKGITEPWSKAADFSPCKDKRILCYADIRKAFEESVLGPQQEKQPLIVRWKNAVLSFVGVEKPVPELDVETANRALRNAYNQWFDPESGRSQRYQIKAYNRQVFDSYIIVEAQKLCSDINDLNRVLEGIEGTALFDDRGLCSSIEKKEKKPLLDRSTGMILMQDIGEVTAYGLNYIMRGENGYNPLISEQKMKEVRAVSSVSPSVPESAPVDFFEPMKPVVPVLPPPSFP